MVRTCKSTKVVFSILAVFIFMLSAWLLDISVSAMLNENNLTNGWLTPNPILTYHIALMIMITILIVMTILYVDILEIDKK